MIASQVCIIVVVLVSVVVVVCSHELLSVHRNYLAHKDSKGTLRFEL